MQELLLLPIISHESVAFNLKRDVFGEENASTVVAMRNLAATRFMQGKYPEAEELGMQRVDNTKTMSMPYLMSCWVREDRTHG